MLCYIMCVTSSFHLIPVLPAVNAADAVVASFIFLRKQNKNAFTVNQHQHRETIDSKNQRRKKLVNASWLLVLDFSLWSMYRIFVEKALGQLKYESWELGGSMLLLFTWTRLRFRSSHSTKTNVHFSCCLFVFLLFAILLATCIVCASAPIVAVHNFRLSDVLNFSDYFLFDPQNSQPIYYVTFIYWLSLSVYSSYTYIIVLHMFILSFDLFWFQAYRVSEQRMFGTFGQVWLVPSSKQSYLLHGNRLKLLPYCWAYILQLLFWKPSQAKSNDSA